MECLSDYQVHLRQVKNHPFACIACSLLTGHFVDGVCLKLEPSHSFRVTLITQGHSWEISCLKISYINPLDFHLKRLFGYLKRQYHHNIHHLFQTSQSFLVFTLKIVQLLHYDDIYVSTVALQLSK